MSRKLNYHEELLVELVHFVSYGTGLNLRATKQLLQKPISNRNGMSCLDCLDKEGRAFLNELITYINDAEEAKD